MWRGGDGGCDCELWSYTHTRATNRQVPSEFCLCDLQRVRAPLRPAWCILPLIHSTSPPPPPPPTTTTTTTDSTPHPTHTRAHALLIWREQRPCGPTHRHRSTHTRTQHTHTHTHNAAQCQQSVGIIISTSSCQWWCISISTVSSCSRSRRKWCGGALGSRARSPTAQRQLLQL